MAHFAKKSKPAFRFKFVLLLVVCTKGGKKKFTGRNFEWENAQKGKGQLFPLF